MLVLFIFTVLILHLMLMLLHLVLALSHGSWLQAMMDAAPPTRVAVSLWNKQGHFVKHLGNFLHVCSLSYRHPNSTDLTPGPCAPSRVTHLLANSLFWWQLPLPRLAIETQLAHSTFPRASWTQAIWQAAARLQRGATSSYLQLWDLAFRNARPSWWSDVPSNLTSSQKAKSRFRFLNCWQFAKWGRFARRAEDIFQRRWGPLSSTPNGLSLWDPCGAFVSALSPPRLQTTLVCRMAAAFAAIRQRLFGTRISMRCYLTEHRRSMRVLLWRIFTMTKCTATGNSSECRCFWFGAGKTLSWVPGGDSHPGGESRSLSCQERFVWRTDYKSCSPIVFPLWINHISTIYEILPHRSLPT